jgi:hypothetical protein
MNCIVLKCFERVHILCRPEFDGLQSELTYGPRVGVSASYSEKLSASVGSPDIGPGMYGAGASTASAGTGVEYVTAGSGAGRPVGYGLGGRRGGGGGSYSAGSSPGHTSVAISADADRLAVSARALSRDTRMFPFAVSCVLRHSFVSAVNNTLLCILSGVL